MAQLPGVQAGRRAIEAPTRSAGAARMRRLVLPIAQHGILIIAVLIFVIPIYWMVISGLKNTGEIFARPLIWWPHVVRWGNLPATLSYPGFPFLRFLWNSFFYAGSVTVGTVLSCAAVGYGFARLRFPGRDVLFIIALGSMMVPSIVTFIPTYILFKYLGMLGGYGPLIIPSFVAATPGVSALFIFMLRQFYLGLPWELSDAAKVDGAGEWRTFWQIMLPLVRSALIVVAVFTFTWTWQEFFGPLIYLSDASQYPLSLGLFAFQSQHTTDWPLMMMASTLTTVPLVVLFFVAQRYFLQGITLTGIKG